MQNERLIALAGTEPALVQQRQWRMSVDCSSERLDFFVDNSGPTIRHFIEA